jgi:hypothetical protein
MIFKGKFKMFHIILMFKVGLVSVLQVIFEFNLLSLKFVVFEEQIIVFCLELLKFLIYVLESLLVVSLLFLKFA